MKTLIFEPDPGRARGHVALFGDDPAHVDVARSLAQARLMLVNTRYDRLALTRGTGAAKALLGLARATSPDCVMVDLGSMRARPVSGPGEDAELIQPA
jgi:hypothetical protein